MPEFNALTFTYQKTLKTASAYLIEQDGVSMVLKAEALTRQSGMGPGQTVGPKSGARTAWLRSHDNKSPEVKKSIEIAGKIIAYVTDETGFESTRSLSKLEVGVVATRLKATATDLQGRGEEALDALKSMVWMAMPCFESVKSLDERPFPLSILNNLKTRTEAFDSLGRVLICDSFLCNADRLGALTTQTNTNTRQYRPWGDDSVQAKNVFLTWYPLRFLALDFFDTQNSPTATMGNVWKESDFQGQTAGDVLLHNFRLLHKGKTKDRDRAAHAALHWLGKCFDPHVTFGPEAEKAVRDGMRAGRDRLESFYKHRVNERLWPSGLKSRFKACGW